MSHVPHERSHTNESCPTRTSRITHEQVTSHMTGSRHTKGHTKTLTDSTAAIVFPALILSPAHVKKKGNTSLLLPFKGNGSSLLPFKGNASSVLLVKGQASFLFRAMGRHLCHLRVMRHHFCHLRVTRRHVCLLRAEHHHFKSNGT